MKERRECSKTSLKSEAAAFYTVLWLISDHHPHRFKVDGELKYLNDAKTLFRPERNTLTVCFLDVEEFSTKLATTILESYYRYGMVDSNLVC